MFSKLHHICKYSFVHTGQLHSLYENLIKVYIASLQQQLCFFSDFLHYVRVCMCACVCVCVCVYLNLWSAAVLGVCPLFSTQQSAMACPSAIKETQFSII